MNGIFVASPQSFSLVNLGCKVNRVETDGYRALFVYFGCRQVPLSEADVVIVNTCTVTGEAEKKTRQAIHRVLDTNTQATVLLTGCSVALGEGAAFYAALNPRIRVVAKAAMESAIAALFCPSVGGTIAASEIACGAVRAAGACAEPDSDLPAATCEAFAATPDVPAPTALLRLGNEFPTRVGIKVQDGCDNACTYCIVHTARGKSVSRPAPDILNEVNAYAQHGVKEFVLTGINLGKYSSDGLSLTHLLERLLEETACYTTQKSFVRFRVSSIEPKNVTAEFIALLSTAEGRICRHLHLPLQSGSDKVLREMARPYSAGFYANLVDGLRGAIGGLSLSTDCIVGFPGETEDDFADTVALCRHAGFSKIHVFPYSMRAGTPAAARTDQVSPDIKARRAAALRALSDELAAADLAARIGTMQRVIALGQGKCFSESGHTLDLPDVHVPGEMFAHVL